MEKITKILKEKKEFHSTKVVKAYLESGSAPTKVGATLNFSISYGTNLEIYFQLQKNIRYINFTLKFSF